MIQATIKRLWIILLLATSVSYANGIQKGLDSLINKMNPHVNLGMVVVDLTTGSTLYSRNPGRFFIPASNMKLFSEAAALMILGPDYRFTNQLSTNANRIQDGVLQGNLYLHLSGDPSFSRRDLETLLSSLKKWHITAIQGNVLIDSSLANVAPYSPGFLTADLSYTYGAPIAPLMLDSNRLSVTVNPGSQVGSPALVEVNDGGGFIPVRNQAITKASSKGCGVGVYLDKDDQLAVHGCLGVGQWAVEQHMAIKNPLLYAQGLIKSQLAEMGIQLNGQVNLGKVPQGAMLLATEHSRPLTQLMADTLKPSDNLYADSLYLHAAATLAKGPVNWKEAQPVMKRFLQEQTGIDFNFAIFTDGSGLSRYNLVTPAQTIQLLQFLYQRFPLAYEYIAALPISGRDGTLQKRLRMPSQQGFVRAKTGSMTGMNSLSGYLYTSNGHTLAFAMFINRKPGAQGGGPGRPLLDALTAYLLQQSPGSSKFAHLATAHSRVTFQANPTALERQRAQQARWRHLEAIVKSALHGQPVAVVYRGNELLVQDNQADANRVWSALSAASRKFPFAVAVSAKRLSINANSSPMLLWVKAAGAEGNQRTWVIREAV